VNPDGTELYQKRGKEPNGIRLTSFEEVREGFSRFAEFEKKPLFLNIFKADDHGKSPPHRRRLV
jgi:hypothetical protein